MFTSAPLRHRHGPLDVYLQAFDGQVQLERLLDRLDLSSPVVWLDSARTHVLTGRWSLLGCDPWLRLEASGDRAICRTSASTRSWRGDPFDALRQVLRRYSGPQRPWAHQRAVGLLGFLGYDLNRWIEKLPEPQGEASSLPEMLWFAMGLTVLVDHHENRSWVVSVADPHRSPSLAKREACERLERAGALIARCAQPDAESSGQVRRFEASAPEPRTTQPEFESQAERILRHIRAGDIFQANLSQRFSGVWKGDPRGLYRTLRRVNPSPFAAFLADGRRAVASCSPERLVRVQEGRVDTRPIAGTRPRGANPEEDAIKSLELLLNEKERAEHIMLVDLERNDLGRICEPGSVRVGELMGLEAYSHVMHIVSEVEGRLGSGADPVAVVRAVFPGGTITGCPKVRCMQILRELETVRRGLYTGSIGYLNFDGTLDLNIAIRTIVLEEDRYSLHAGAGIVADSDPEREYHETLAKAQALKTALFDARHETPHDKTAAR